MTSTLIFVTVYRRSSLHVTEVFCDELTSLFKIILTYKSTVIISGDFNIHMDDPNDITAKHFRDLLNAFGLTQHVNDATHVYDHTLDLIITQPNFSPTLVITNPPIISDHEPILCDFAVVRSTPAPLRQVVSRRLKVVNSELLLVLSLSCPYVLIYHC